MKKHVSSAWFLLVLVVVIWSANWPIMKIGLRSIDPWGFTVARLAIALVAISILLLCMGQFKRPHKQDLPIVFSVGILLFAAFVIFIHEGLAHVNAGRAALLSYTTPLWVAPGAYFFLKEKITRFKLIGLSLGLCGLIILFNPLSFDWGNSEVAKGNILLVMAAVVWAASIVHVRSHQWQGSVLSLTPWQILVALVVVLPLAWFADTRPTQWSGELVLILLYNGMLATGLAQWASMRITQLLPAVTVSIGFLLVPVAGILLSSIWLGEPFTVVLATGMALIICSLLFQINWRKFKER
ncbi:MAG: multidrug transporter permease [Cycloclasticus sp. symbiont of Poecilosclerida sp. M]|nr:MAG: multidrug transporter permease [Cycloclasticus sp. symbiont of Poecilosclerida sp. M]